MLCTTAPFGGDGAFAGMERRRIKTALLPSLVSGKSLPVGPNDAYRLWLTVEAGGDPGNVG
jgi:hypothetical protein